MKVHRKGEGAIVILDKKEVANITDFMGIQAMVGAIAENDLTKVGLLIAQLSETKLGKRLRLSKSGRAAYQKALAHFFSKASDEELREWKAIAEA